MYTALNEKRGDSYEWWTGNDAQESSHACYKVLSQNLYGWSESNKRIKESASKDPDLALPIKLKYWEGQLTDWFNLFNNIFQLHILRRGILNN